MLKILCTDDPDGHGFELTLEMNGDAFMIAKQLDIALREITKKSPQVIDILTYLQTMKASFASEKTGNEKTGNE